MSNLNPNKLPFNARVEHLRESLHKAVVSTRNATLYSFPGIEARAQAEEQQHRAAEGIGAVAANAPVLTELAPIIPINNVNQESVPQSQVLESGEQLASIISMPEINQAPSVQLTPEEQALADIRRTVAEVA